MLVLVLGHLEKDSFALPVEDSSSCLRYRHRPTHEGSSHGDRDLAGDSNSGSHNGCKGSRCVTTFSSATIV